MNPNLSRRGWRFLAKGRRLIGYKLQPFCAKIGWKWKGTPSEGRKLQLLMHGVSNAFCVMPSIYYTFVLRGYPFFYYSAVRQYNLLLSAIAIVQLLPSVPACQNNLTA